jgi:hypothetical protein
VEEYAARIAPTEYAQSLLDHLKTEPEGFSRAEAQEFMQSHAEELRAEVERTLAEKQDGDTFEASAEAVKAQLLADLNALGRFTPAKNEADAMLFASYYAVRAAQMGTTPEELFAQRPVRFNAERIDGPQFEQALASQPPKGWTHSVDGADAAALWEGQEGTEAVFWTDLQGKLAQDAPAVAGYSHSVNRSAVAHIRKQHGDAATEAERGQLPVTAGDLARIPEIVTNYDAVRTDLQGDGGAPEVAFSKRVSDGVLVYLARVSNKRSNLSAVSMWKFPPETDAATVLNHAVKEKAPRDAGPGDALRPLSEYESDAQAPSPEDSLVRNGRALNRGDQGGVAKRDALLSMPAANAIFTEAENPDFSAAKKAAKARYAAFQAATGALGFGVRTTDGRQIKFSGAGFKEAAQHAADRRVLATLATLASLDRLFASALPLYSEPAHGKQQVKAFHYYGVKADFGNRGEAFVLLEVIERPNGDFFYDADATSADEMLAASSVPLAAQSETEAGNKLAASKGRLAAWIAGVNNAEVLYQDKGVSNRGSFNPETFTVRRRCGRRTASPDQRRSRGRPSPSVRRELSSTIAKRPGNK